MKSSAASSNGTTPRKPTRAGAEAASAPSKGSTPASGLAPPKAAGAGPPAPPTGVAPILESLPVEAPSVELPGGEPFRHDRGYLLVKRAVDVVAAGVALVVLAPLLLLIALLIKLEDGGPVLFFQTRVGKGGRHFRFWKFRSMTVDAETRREEVKALAPRDEVSDRLRFKMQDDPRVTRAGRVLRRFSLDELPQLWNVLAGDMTLVGPRPPIPEEVAEYSARHRRRLEVEQGLTCLWQVSGRNLLSFEQQVELDIEYARRRGLALDLALLLRTIPAVLSGRGAC